MSQQTECIDQYVCNIHNHVRLIGNLCNTIFDFSGCSENVEIICQYDPAQKDKPKIFAKLYPITYNITPVAEFYLWGEDRSSSPRHEATQVLLTKTKFSTIIKALDELFEKINKYFKNHKNQIQTLEDVFANYPSHKEYLAFSELK